MVFFAPPPPGSFDPLLEILGAGRQAFHHGLASGTMVPWLSTHGEMAIEIVDLPIENGDFP